MTLKALEIFCRPSTPPSYSGLTSEGKQEKETDYALLRHLTQKVECMAADAAADEQLALRDLAGISGPNVVELQEVMSQAFPNLKAPRVFLQRRN
jgi:hypothetical protein